MSCAAYDQLKQQIAQLRADAADLAVGKAAVRGAESAALLSAKLAHEEQMAEARAEAAALHARLRESVDRAARLRQLAERCEHSCHHAHVRLCCPAAQLCRSSAHLHVRD